MRIGQPFQLEADGPFSYRDGILHAGGLPVEELAAAAGTPLYLYVLDAVETACRRLQTAFRPGRVLYSVKVNGNLAVLRRLAAIGAGFDVVSGGELLRVLRAGGRPERTVFAGVGKTHEELELAVRCGVVLHVESADELAALQAVSARLAAGARFGLRVNPDVEAGFHPYLRTGHDEAKFGLPAGTAVELYYNGQPRPAEVVVSGGQAFVTRRQETWEDLLAWESGPARRLAVGSRRRRRLAVHSLPDHRVCRGRTVGDGVAWAPSSTSAGRHHSASSAPWTEHDSASHRSSGSSQSHRRERPDPQQQVHQTADRRRPTVTRPHVRCAQGFAWPATPQRLLNEAVSYQADPTKKTIARSGASKDGAPAYQAGAPSRRCDRKREPLLWPVSSRSSLTGRTTIGSGAAVNPLSSVTAPEGDKAIVERRGWPSQPALGGRDVLHLFLGQAGR